MLAWLSPTWSLWGRDHVVTMAIYGNIICWASSRPRSFQCLCNSYLIHLSTITKLFTNSTKNCISNTELLRVTMSNCKWIIHVFTIFAWCLKVTDRWLCPNQAEHLFFELHAYSVFQNCYSLSIPVSHECLSQTHRLFVRTVCAEILKLKLFAAQILS